MGNTRAKKTLTQVVEIIGTRRSVCCASDIRCPHPGMPGRLRQDERHYTVRREEITPRTTPWKFKHDSRSDVLLEF